MRLLSSFLVATALAVTACAQPNRPVQEPAGRVQTTNAIVSNPSYGTSDMDGWSDPAATGNATHGSATWATTARADAGAP